MTANNRRSLERVTAFLSSVYGIMKVCLDFYALVHGH